VLGHREHAHQRVEVLSFRRPPSRCSGKSAAMARGAA
jgi:hypothetical protein